MIHINTLLQTPSALCFLLAWTHELNNSGENQPILDEAKQIPNTGGVGFSINIDSIISLILVKFSPIFSTIATKLVFS